MNYLIISAALLAIVGSAEVDKKNSVKLTVFYESYCPYSIDFIVNQLYGVWGQYAKQIKLDMVPFGNAKQSYDHGHFNFTCQHGPKECVGNILHACAIYQACGPKGTLHCPAAKLTKAMNYINCVVQTADQRQASDQCASTAKLHKSAITKCARSKLGERLESWYGNETAAFKNPPVQYVPFIVINNKHTEKEQDEAQSDLKSLICQYIKC